MPGYLECELKLYWPGPGVLLKLFKLDPLNFLPMVIWGPKFLEPTS